MARGLHSFTYHPHIYPQMEWAILHSLCKHSPDGVTWARWRASRSAYYSSIDPERMKGWVSLVGWPYSGWFTHISDHPSATGRAWDRESSPVKDRRVTTVQRNQHVDVNAAKWLCLCVRKGWNSNNGTSSKPHAYKTTGMVELPGIPSSRKTLTIH